MQRLPLLALAASLCLPTLVEAAVLCPATQGGQRLRAVSVFDGPPSEMVRLVPEQQGQRDRWDTAAIRQGGRPGYLVCEYEGGRGRIEREVPAAARQCTTTRAPGNRGFAAVDCR